MTQRLQRAAAVMLCGLLLLLPMCLPASYATEEIPALITDYPALMAAVNEAKEGDTLLVGDIDFTPLSPDVPYSMMTVTVEKSITIKSGKGDTPARFANGGFVLSGSKVTGEGISVRFENIIFDGLCDYDTLTEKDYEYPWNDALQEYTYFAPLKAQQALSFKGNVEADFTGCVFQNYMHEYGPVIDIRYGDYTDNEYLSNLFPDYSGCRLDIQMTDCCIRKNSALYDGGAIYMDGNHNVRFSADRCTFADNRSTIGEFSRGGGAIFAVGVSLEITHSTLAGNIANYVFPDSSIPEYDTLKGGALLMENCKLTMVDSILKENRASIGGALSMTNTKAELDGCRLLQNRAETAAVHPNGQKGPWTNMAMGGALYIEGNSNDTVAIYNSEIKDNSAANAYGGIYGFYYPWDDPSFGTYRLKLILCSYQGNNADTAYDYSTAGDYLWMSHPGDMLSCPYFTLQGCYIADETYAADFPRSEAPTAANGYNSIGASPDGELTDFPIPADAAAVMIGDRYGDKLEAVHIGSNYSESLYREEADPPIVTPPTTDPVEPPATDEPSPPKTEESLPGVDGENDLTGGGDQPDPTTDPKDTDRSHIWWIIGGVLALGAVTVTVILVHRKKREVPVAIQPAPIPSEPALEKKQIVMVRYTDEQIDRFMELVPETHLLTVRESEVLREILRGKKQSEVAYYLGIEVSTVKDFSKKIYSKLDVPNKAGLFTKASELLNL